MSDLPTYHKGKRNFGTGYDMMDRIEALEAEAEGALAIIAVERAEVIKLREENERLRGTLVWVADVTSHSMGLTKNEERTINKVATSAMKGDSDD
jgi:hypothetical protein